MIGGTPWYPANGAASAVSGGTAIYIAPQVTQHGAPLDSGLLNQAGPGHLAGASFREFWPMPEANQVDAFTTAAIAVLTCLVACWSIARRRFVLRAAPD
jgi:hypothetical protein